MADDESKLFQKECELAEIVRVYLYANDTPNEVKSAMTELNARLLHMEINTDAIVNSFGYRVREELRNPKETVVSLNYILFDIVGKIRAKKGLPSGYKKLRKP